MKIEYSADGKSALYGDYRFRKDPKTGYYLSSKKTDVGKRERLHNYVYRKEKGDIPKGYHVHHIDQNKDNNDISNLTTLSKHEHEVLHGQLLTDEDKKARKENVIKNAMPKAKEWHSSTEGAKWHSKHGKAIWDNRIPKEYICTYCGNHYTSKHIYSSTSNHFCSNNCRAAFRRQLGVDNVARKCEKCGEQFITNKYSQAKLCECCRYIKH